MESSHGRVPAGTPGVPDRSPLCHAPFVAMEFDPFGDVQACCANALYPLGNVTRSSLREIWEGPRAQAMRDALTEGDMSLGCTVCRYRLTYGHGELPLQYYDNFPLPEDPPEWPYSLQFSLHNTCNLECVMCGADRSSKIRARRSHLDPLPHVYGNRFFEELEPFLAHCGAIDLSGGEPFLVPEHERVWDLLIAMDHRPLCSLTTNGTVWNDRVEKVLDHLDTHISVSVDGVTAETFEKIRVGARFVDVMANVERFLDYTRRRGTILTMSWSLVQDNWHELGRGMLFCEERGIHMKVQTVIEPEYGLQRLPTEGLRHIVESLEAEGTTLAPQLALNRDMWDREVQRLRQELELRADPALRPLCMEPPGPDNIAHLVAMVLDTAHRRLDAVRHAGALATARRDLDRWCEGSPVARVDIDHQGAVTEVDLDDLLPTGPLFGPDEAPSAFADVLGRIEAALDGRLWIGEEFDEGDRLVQTLWVGRPVRDKMGLVLRLVSIAGNDGVRVLIAADEALLPRDGAGTAVALGATRARPGA